jgi:hypothetical protein
MVKDETRDEMKDEMKEERKHDDAAGNNTSVLGLMRIM